VVSIASQPFRICSFLRVAIIVCQPAGDTAEQGLLQKSPFLIRCGFGGLGRLDAESSGAQPAPVGVRWLAAGADPGRPRPAPEAAVRLMLADLLLGIVHDGRVMREAAMNLAIR
jgi:hypothetical protein